MQRGPWQFTLRSLLLATAALALWLGWLTDRAARQRRAVEELEPRGAELFYDDRLVDCSIQFSLLLGTGFYDQETGRDWRRHQVQQDADGNNLPYDPPDESAWEWLPRWIDKDYFRVLVAVKAFGPAVTPDALRTLSRVGSVKWLALDGAEEIGDEDLEYVARLTRLERLYLARTAVTDAGLAHLSGLPKLRYLSLAGTRITDGGLKNLQSLANLEMLELCDTAVSDAGIMQLKKLKKLSSVFVNGTKVTEKGVGQLRAVLPECFVTLDWPGWAGKAEVDGNETEAK